MKPRWDSPWWPLSLEEGTWSEVSSPGLTALSMADRKHRLWAGTQQKGATSLTPDFTGVSEVLAGTTNRAVNCTIFTQQR